MPTWVIDYQIGRGCSQEDIYREQQVFRNDPWCTYYRSTDSAEYPGRISVQVGVRFANSIGVDSRQILRLRGARPIPAVPAVPTTIPLTPNGNRYMQVSLENSQEGQLSIGSQICIDEQGRVGSRGTPIGVLAYIDRDLNQARIILEPGTPLSAPQSPNPIQIEESYLPPTLTREIIEQERVQFQFQRMLLPDPRVQQARQQIMAEEDARVFEILDSIANNGTYVQQPLPKEPNPAPEPRPTIKTRYERIMDTLKGE